KNKTRGWLGCYKDFTPLGFRTDSREPIQIRNPRLEIPMKSEIRKRTVPAVFVRVSKFLRASIFDFRIPDFSGSGRLVAQSLSDDLQDTILRYSRLQICATF